MFTLVQKDTPHAVEVGEENSECRYHYDEGLVCGPFRRGSVIEARLISTESIDSFHLYKSQLSEEQRELIQTASEFRPQADPYTTRPGDIKIFTSADKVGRRCEIIDLYSRAFKKKLQVFAEIFLIDEAKFMKNIHLSNIYDLPQPLDGIEPEIMRARLDYSSYELGANEYFLTEIQGTNTIKVKILGRRDGIYIVDMILKEGSIVEKLNEAFACKVLSPSDNSESFDETDSAIVPDSVSYSDPRAFTRTKANYIGAKKFFTSQIFKSGIGLSDPQVGRYFFKVKPLYWYSPDSIYLIPDYVAYFETYDRFQDTLHALERDCLIIDSTDVVYKMGQICYIKNEIHPELGEWLRGVVVKAPRSTPSHGQTMRASRISNSLSPDKLLYRVRSIDFGYELIKGAKDLRTVKRANLFLSISTWALGCRLFGVYPLPKFSKVQSVDGYHSGICIDMIDSWIRERTESDAGGSFYAVFQTGLDSRPQDELKTRTAVTLHHYFEGNYDFMNPSPTNDMDRYSCLNTFLVENGYASQYDKTRDIHSNLIPGQNLGRFIIKDYNKL